MYASMWLHAQSESMGFTSCWLASVHLAERACMYMRESALKCESLKVAELPFYCNISVYETQK